MLEPAHADVLEARRTIDKHVAVQVATNDWVTIGRGKPIQPGVADVARSRPQADGIGTQERRVVGDIANVADDHIGTTGGGTTWRASR